MKKIKFGWVKDDKNLTLSLAASAFVVLLITFLEIIYWGINKSLIILKTDFQVEKVWFNVATLVILGVFIIVLVKSYYDLIGVEESIKRDIKKGK